MKANRCELCAIKVGKGYKLCNRCSQAVNTYCIAEKDITFGEGVAHFASIEPLTRIQQLQEWYVR